MSYPYKMMLHGADNTRRRWNQTIGIVRSMNKSFGIRSASHSDEKETMMRRPSDYVLYIIDDSPKSAAAIRLERMYDTRAGDELRRVRTGMARLLQLEGAPYTGRCFERANINDPEVPHHLNFVPVRDRR